MLFLCQLLPLVGNYSRSALITGHQRGAFMYVLLCTPMYELRGVLVAQFLWRKSSVIVAIWMVVVRDAC